MSRFKGYRTYLITTILPIALIAINATIGVYDADPQAEWGVVAMAILAAIMRTVTSTPPGKPQ